MSNLPVLLIILCGWLVTTIIPIIDYYTNAYKFMSISTLVSFCFSVTLIFGTIYLSVVL